FDHHPRDAAGDDGDRDDPRYPAFELHVGQGDTSILNSGCWLVANCCGAIPKAYNGISSRAVVPTFSLEASVISPACARAIRLARASPRPTPPVLRVRLPSARQNGVNARSSSSGVMPMPLSMTSNTARSDTGRTSRRSGVDGSEYLAALSSRLSSARRSRIGSHWIAAFSIVLSSTRP